MEALVELLARMVPGEWYGRGRVKLMEGAGGCILRNAVKCGFLEYKRDVATFGEYRLTERVESTSRLLKHVGF